MGVVYRARDTKLSRDVALKVLLPDVAGDTERLARLVREAQLLASLNHPNIAQVHGFEDAQPSGPGEAGVRALVMELVEGPTLADRIAQGRLSLEEALPIASQIADALEAAHEQGIVHRDLKPANIKLKARTTPRTEDSRGERGVSTADVSDCVVKVLDFGLAKAIESASSSSSMHVSMSPTITHLRQGYGGQATPAMTQAGFILGTAAYMSPEQAKGRAVDKRSDVWAFGCVLFEMLTGLRAFGGEDVPETLAHVLTKDPDWTALPATTPASIRTLLKQLPGE
jgi:serine/threonine protein kinase